MRVFQVADHAASHNPPESGGHQMDARRVLHVKLCHWHSAVKRLAGRGACPGLKHASSRRSRLTWRLWGTCAPSLSRFLRQDGDFDFLSSPRLISRMCRPHHYCLLEPLRFFITNTPCALSQTSNPPSAKMGIDLYQDRGVPVSQETTLEATQPHRVFTL